jgi:hypothetical protein
MKVSPRRKTMRFVQVGFLTLFLAAICAAQQQPQVLTQTTGINAPNPGDCVDTPNLHSTYMQTGDPANAFAGEWICVQSSSRGFAWAAVAMLPPGTTGTHGTELVYNSFCGSTVGNQACSNQTNGATVRTISGLAILTSGSAVISGISPAYTGTATFSCLGQDTTTSSNAVKVANTSVSSVTITGTGSDAISWICSGY